MYTKNKAIYNKNKKGMIYKMKKSKILITTLIITLLLSAICLNTNVFATDVDNTQVTGEPRTTAGEPVATSDEPNTIADNEQNHNENVHEGDLYVLYGEDGNYTNSTYTMNKDVDGNVFIFGQDVKITGKINGSLYVFAGTVTIEENAYIATHAFIFAETIRMNGFSYDMYAASKNFEMTKTGVVYRDLKVGADNAVIYGQIGRNLDLASENIQVYKDEETRSLCRRKLKLLFR